MISPALIPGAEWLPLLAQLALKSTLILLVAWMAATALWRSSAAVRHMVWCVGVAGVLALPLFYAVLPAWNVTVLPASTGAPVAAPAVSTSSVVLDEAPAEDPSDAVAPVSEEGSRGRYAWVPRAAVAVAAGGVVAGLVWLALGFWGVARLGRRAQVVRDPAWLRTATDAADQLGLRRPVLLLRARGAVMPATGGLLWPSVVLPDTADQWPDDRRHAVLAHELAHVKRFDTLTQALAQVACVLFWWHPAVWYAAKRLRIERERACDDLVLRAGTRASDYAGHLLEIARSHRGPRLSAAALVSMARPSQLESRLLWVLDGARVRGVPSARATLLTVAAALLLVVPLSAMRPIAATGSSGGNGLFAALLEDGQDVQNDYAQDRKTDAHDRAKDRAVDGADAGADASVEAGMKRGRAPGDTIPTVDELVAMRAVGVDAAYIAELRAAGYTVLTPEELISMRATGVSGRYAAEIADAGFGRVDAEDLVGMRAVDVTPAYVAELRSNGFTNLTPELVTGMRAVGVNGDYMVFLRRNGYTGLSADEVMGMRSVGVDADFIQQMRDAGYDRLSAEELTSFRALRVTPEFLRELERLGFPRLSADEVESMRSLNVNADYVAQLRAAGLQGLDAETVIDLRSVGVTSAYIRELAEVGLTGLTAEQLVELRGARVTAAYVRELEAAGFRQLSADELVRLRNSGVDGELIRSRTRERVRQNP
ncbi:MAG TPA: M56 family metallopeptidase [Longimicrobium sp.]|nr:M56 family metallopeptidase [Longimicrobium sp.]